MSAGTAGVPYLVAVRGQDGPGIAARLFGGLEGLGVVVVETLGVARDQIEQCVARLEQLKPRFRVHIPSPSPLSSLCRAFIAQ